MRIYRAGLLRIGGLAVGVLLLMAGFCLAGELTFSDQEQAWLATHPVVRLGIDAGYGPYSYLDADGRMQGLVADYLADIEHSLKIRFEIIADLSWPQLMDGVRAHRLDAVATVVKLPEREEFLAFSDIYLTTPLVVMTRDDRPPLDSLAELQKLRLALVDGYSSSKQLLARYPGLNAVLVTTPLEGLQRVAFGSADAYVGVLGVNSFLAAQNGISNIKINAAIDMPANGQRFAVRKDWPLLAHLLDRALKAMPLEHKNAIFQRWLPKHFEQINRLEPTGYRAHIFPWVLAGFGLVILAYLMVLLWNRQLKAELARRSADLERAQAVAHIGDWSWDMASGRIRWSDELFRIAGRKPQSVELDWSQLRGWLHPDTRESYQAYFKQMRCLAPGETLPPLLSHLLRPEGESRWVEISCKVEFDATGRACNLYGTAQDVTARVLVEQELRSSETRLRTLVENLPDLVWIKDTDGVYLACNPKFERYFGAKQDEIIGKTDYDFVAPELADFFREKDLAAIVAKRPIRNEEEVVYADDGHRELLETVKSPMFSAEGKLIGVLGVGHDISERKNAEQALRRSQKMDAIGQLTGGIAHDFNNILSIILGAVELLERQPAIADRTLTRVATIKKSARRAAELTQQLLGFSHKHAAQCAVSNLNQQIVDMESLIARSLTPQVEVELQLAADLWPVEIDPGDFQDALLNLVLNAKDAMAGIGQLTIETRNLVLDATSSVLEPDVLPGEYVELAVSDSGAGISEDMQEHIFEPFFTTKGLGNGTGLGLAMVYGFVKRSGGAIKFYTEVQVGTTFRIYLPRTERDLVVQQVEEVGVLPLPGGRETLLVVDDEVDLLELAREFLDALGYRVLVATNGPQALDVLTADQDIALLFSDVVMPGGMNGYELAKEAHKRNAKLKILLSSGFTERAVAHNGPARFRDNLLSKPYTQAELARRVRTLLDERGSDG